MNLQRIITHLDGFIDIDFFELKNSLLCKTEKSQTFHKIIIVSHAKRLSRYVKVE